MRYKLLGAWCRKAGLERECKTAIKQGQSLQIDITHQNCSQLPERTQRRQWARSPTSSLPAVLQGILGKQFIQVGRGSGRHDVGAASQGSSEIVVGGKDGFHEQAGQELAPSDKQHQVGWAIFAGEVVGKIGENSPKFPKTARCLQQSPINSQKGTFSWNCVSSYWIFWVAIACG